ncbi:MAG TPA: coproporphyrinogen III oxidase [Erysipelotrichaceae bacterium]|nr:coproporphyrinogen III oxidase [Erysipelotrichaceae bacterium]
MMTLKSNTPQSMYLHVPFCRTICSYCDFCHTVYRRERAEAWLNALKEDLSSRKIPASSQKTVYIGGGTPTCLDADLLDRLLSMLDFCVGENCEYTAEVNPETLDQEKAQIMAAHGITRASIGFQTDNPRLLKMMNRHHTAETVRESMELLRENGIADISLDLMYSLPEQTMEDLKQAVHTAVSFDPDHLSLYSLTIEKNTVFGKKGFQSLDEDTEADMYEWICDTLPEYGYEQYEISNFAKQGHESRHNLAYWHYDDFYGISCGASGKENGVRYDVVRNLDEYIHDPGRREDIVLDKKDRMFETVMMGLRLKKGVSLKLFEERFGIPLKEAMPVSSRLSEEGLLEWHDGYLRCTDRGYPVLNSILVEFLD